MMHSGWGKAIAFYTTGLMLLVTAGLGLIAGLVLRISARDCPVSLLGGDQLCELEREIANNTANSYIIGAIILGVVAAVLVGIGNSWMRDLDREASKE